MCRRDTTRRTDIIPAEPPAVLTVDETAASLRISRNNAYKGVRKYIATGGKEGIPAERIGKQFRISRHRLEEYIGGPITWPIPGYHDVPEPEPPSQPTRQTRATARDLPPDTQPSLFPL